MIKREFKVNLKSLIIWSLICMGLFLICFLVYPSIIDSSNMTSINQMMESFPKEILKMFNMDICDITSVYGWFKTEGYTFLLLIIGLYSGILGSSILVKEENDKTIEFLFAKPISRNRIIISKMLYGVISIVILVLSVYLFNLCGMILSNDLDFISFTMLSLGILLMAIPIFFISLAISTLFNKSRKTLTIGIALVFISYFIQLVSNMGKNVEFFKYFSLFSLIDSRSIILNKDLNIITIIISIVISIVSVILTFIIYNKKELV